MPLRQRNASITYARDDVESLGMILIFMLSGMYPPWDGLRPAKEIEMKKNTPVSVCSSEHKFS